MILKCSEFFSLFGHGGRFEETTVSLCLEFLGNSLSIESEAAYEL